MKKLSFLVALMCANMFAFAAPNVAAPIPTWPADQVIAFYSDSYTTASTWNFNAAWNQNTALAEENISGNHYLHYTNFNYLGWVITTGNPYNALNMEKLHIDIWADANGEIGIVPIYGGEGLTTDDSHRKIVNLTGGQWNSFDLDLAVDFAGLNLASIFQVKLDNGTITEFAVDNAFFYRTSALEDTEKPQALTGSVASASYFSVTLAVSATDNMGAVNYSVKNGTTEVGTGAGASGATVNITIANLTPATDYSFSIVASDGNGNTTDPITIPASTLAAPAPATTPTYSAENVLALYSDVYSDLAWWFDNWYAGPAFTEGSLTASSNASCITPNTTPSSCGGITFAAPDLTASDALEMDVYATVASSVLDIQVIGVGAASTTFNLNAGQWNHIVLDIKGNTKTDCTQLGFYNCNNLLGICFVQNILFVKENATAIDNVETNVNVQKVIENGQLIIIKNGARYNVAGQEVK